jgi:hypothetical protein
MTWIILLPKVGRKPQAWLFGLLFGRSSESNARRDQAREIGYCRSSGIDVAVRR